MKRSPILRAVKPPFTVAGFGPVSGSFCLHTMPKKFTDATGRRLVEYLPASGVLYGVEMSEDPQRLGHVRDIPVNELYRVVQGRLCPDCRIKLAQDTTGL